MNGLNNRLGRLDRDARGRLWRGVFRSKTERTLAMARRNRGRRAVRGGAKRERGQQSQKADHGDRSPPLGPQVERRRRILGSRSRHSRPVRMRKNSSQIGRWAVKDERSFPRRDHDALGGYRECGLAPARPPRPTNSGPTNSALLRRDNDLRLEQQQQRRSDENRAVHARDAADDHAEGKAVNRFAAPDIKD